MKKILVMVIAVLAFVAVSAQPPQGGQRGGNRGGKTIEMLQKRLQMTPEQAKKFAPVYDGYMREIRAVRKDTKTYIDSFNDEEMTIKVAKKIMMAQLNGDKEVIKVKKEYIRVFVNYLTPEQLSKVFTLGQGPRGPRGLRGGGQLGQPGPQAQN